MKEQEILLSEILKTLVKIEKKIPTCICGVQEQAFAKGKFITGLGLTWFCPIHGRKNLSWGEEP